MVWHYIVTKWFIFPEFFQQTSNKFPIGCIILTHQLSNDMEFNGSASAADHDQPGQENKRPNVPAVMTLTEDDLQSELFKDKKPVREGEPMGGHNFGKNNNTSAANDRNNPSQYAGNTNAYFDRTEPMEEHPEDSNFKAPSQEGSPDYDKAMPEAFKNTTEPKPEKVETGNGENDRPHKGNTYEEGNGDDDNVNIPGPRELPDQQKVGEDVGDDDRYHIET